jgi:hypothetical protein
VESVIEKAAEKADRKAQRVLLVSQKATSDAREEARTPAVSLGVFSILRVILCLELFFAKQLPIGSCLVGEILVLTTRINLENSVFVTIFQRSFPD